MENLYKSVKRLGTFITLHNIGQSLKNPTKALHFVKLYAEIDKEQDQSVKDFIATYFPQRTEESEGFLKELYRTRAYNQKYASGRAGSVDSLILYLVVRFLKPETVVETGVASGKSSSFILQGLADNKSGELYSIELPQYYPANKQADDPSLLTNVEGNIEATGFIPEGKEPGWLIPDALRDRWTLTLGTSKEKMPPLIDKLSSIDAFYHDSEHTYENMLFEFTTAWPHLKKGGFLISDDIHWNTAFDDFVRSLHPHEALVFKRGSIGIIKKI